MDQSSAAFGWHLRDKGIDHVHQVAEEDSPNARSTTTSGQSTPSSAAVRLSFSHERPASPIVTPAGACSARYPAHGRPTKPVAPKTTMSVRRTQFGRLVAQRLSVEDECGTHETGCATTIRLRLYPPRSGLNSPAQVINTSRGGPPMSKTFVSSTRSVRGTWRTVVILYA